jgi:hypothetical protein
MRSGELACIIREYARPYYEQFAKELWFREIAETASATDGVVIASGANG